MNGVLEADMTRNDNLCIWEVKEATKKIAELEESIPLKIKELNDLTESLNEVTWKFRIPTILKGDHRLYGALDNLSGAWSESSEGCL